MGHLRSGLTAATFGVPVRPVMRLGAFRMGFPRPYVWCPGTSGNEVGALRPELFTCRAKRYHTVSNNARNPQTLASSRCSAPSDMRARNASWNWFATLELHHDAPS